MRPRRSCSWCLVLRHPCNPLCQGLASGLCGVAASPRSACRCCLHLLLCTAEQHGLQPLARFLKEWERCIMHACHYAASENHLVVGHGRCLQLFLVPCAACVMHVRARGNTIRWHNCTQAVDGTKVLCKASTSMHRANKFGAYRRKAYVVLWRFGFCFLLIGA